MLFQILVLSPQYIFDFLITSFDWLLPFIFLFICIYLYCVRAIRACQFISLKLLLAHILFRDELKIFKLLWLHWGILTFLIFILNRSRELLIMRATYIRSWWSIAILFLAFDEFSDITTIIYWFPLFFSAKLFWGNFSILSIPVNRFWLLF